MAETGLSMATSLVGSAVSKAASAAAAEMSLLMGVQKEIWFIKDELKTMQAFLIAPEVTKKKDKLVKVWAEQVRELSYDIEDCLDEFMVHVGSKCLSQQLMKLKDRHRIAIQIRNLKSRVEEVSSRNTRYNLIKTEASSTTDEIDSYMEDVRNHSASNINEAELVGFSKPKEELLNLIDVHANNGPARVVCVVGMGGLGKTTIARKIYESKEDIAKNFSCRAWITVSQSFVRMELLKDMIRGLFGDEALKKELEGKSRIEDLASYLKEELNEKRYFVVLDDLWSIDAWKWIDSIAFPSNNIKGSRIIVTTRDVGLAEQCTSGSLIYHHKPLQEHDAKDLLLRKTKTNERNEDMKNDENMSNIVTKIVKKCGCLPLAILTIGGVLATKKVTEWENFYKQLPSELESNPGLEAMRRMVTLSYNYLPSHLKPCFLYLSIFPEDFEIQRRRLVDRWIAEGFVKARAGMTIEDVGKCYFNELANRSLIQPSRVSIKGAPKSCRVHDIMRDIIVSISREEKFVFLSGDIGTDVAQENIRHIAFHGSKCAKTSFDWNIIRSLTLFGERPNELAPSLCLPQLRMLRVLDLEDAQFSITQKDINNITLFRHLKYLRVKAFSYIYSLPRSIGKLQGLQTLDLPWTYIATLPTEISKLHGLHSLRCSRTPYYSYFDLDRPKRCLSNTMCLPQIFTPLVDPDIRAMRIAELHNATSTCWSKTNGVKVPKGIGSLRELQILEVVDIKRTSSKAIEELGELTQLRKLSVTTQGASEQKHKILCEAIQKFSSLQSLRVDATKGYSDAGTLEWMNSVSSPPPLLRTLVLSGYLGEMPDLFGSLTQLVKLSLWRSRLNEGSKTMEILGALPNLMLLYLGGNVYAGEKLVFREGAFPNLRKLYIWYLEGELREVRFEEGAPPLMEEIEIRNGRLESGIIGTKHLPRLKDISLGGGSKVAKLGTLQEEVDAHPNHPVLRMEENRSRHDLGDVQGFEEVAVEATESLAEPAGEVATLTTDDS